MQSVETIGNVVEQLVKSKLIGIDDSTITHDSILNECGIDSIKMIELIIEIEDAFDIEFKPDSLDYSILRNIKSISKQVEYMIPR